MHIGNDQNQLYSKGHLLATHSIWTHYGNASSGGLGYIPGSLTTALVGIPMMIWYSPYSPLILIILLHIIAYALLDNLICKILGPTARILFAIFYWCNPWRSFQIFLWNPSYLFFCTALHFWSCFHMRERKKVWPTLLNVFSIGMAGQIHNSSLILALLSIFLFWRKLIKVHWPTFICTVAIVLLSLVPYFGLFYQGALPSNHDPGAFFGKGLLHGGFLKGISYWFRYGSFMFPRAVVANTYFYWLTKDIFIAETLKIIWLLIHYLVGITTLIYSLSANVSFFKQIKHKIFNRNIIPPNIQTWTLLYCGGTFIASLITALLSPITFVHWHLIIVFFPALYPVFLSVFKDSTKNPKYWRPIFCTIIIYLGLTNIAPIFESHWSRFSTDYKKLHKEFFQKVHSGIYDP